MLGPAPVAIPLGIAHREHIAQYRIHPAHLALFPPVSQLVGEGVPQLVLADDVDRIHRDRVPGAHVFGQVAHADSPGSDQAHRPDRLPKEGIQRVGIGTMRQLPDYTGCVSGIGDTVHRVARQGVEDQLGQDAGQTAGICGLEDAIVDPEHVGDSAAELSGISQPRARRWTLAHPIVALDRWVVQEDGSARRAEAESICGES